jgi:hypothetical protein
VQDHGGPLRDRLIFFRVGFGVLEVTGQATAVQMPSGRSFTAARNGVTVASRVRLRLGRWGEVVDVRFVGDGAQDVVYSGVDDDRAPSQLALVKSRRGPASSTSTDSHRPLRLLLVESC